MDSAQEIYNYQLKKSWTKITVWDSDDLLPLGQN